MRRHQGDKRNRPGERGSGGGQHHPDQHQQQPRAFNPHAQGAGGIVTHLQQPHAPRQQRPADQHQQNQRRRGPGFSPGQTVKRTGIPQPGGEGGFQRSAQQQPGIECHQHSAHADADNNQAKGFNPVAPRQQPDRQRGKDPASHCRHGDGRQVLAKHHHRYQHAAPGPGVKPHHVRAPQRVAGQRLENRAADAEGGANQQRHQHAGQAPLGHHHGDVARRIAEQRRDNLLNAQWHQAGAQPPQGDQRAGDQQQQAAKNQATRRRNHMPPPRGWRRTSQISTGAPIKALTTETRSSPGTSRRPSTSANSSRAGVASRVTGSDQR